MKIGFIGLGIMGESMSENIVKKHDDKVYVFDFIKEKVDLLASKVQYLVQILQKLQKMQMLLSPWFRSQSIPELFIPASWTFWMRPRPVSI